MFLEFNARFPWQSAPTPSLRAAEGYKAARARYSPVSHPCVAQPLGGELFEV